MKIIIFSFLVALGFMTMPIVAQWEQQENLIQFEQPNLYQVETGKPYALEVEESTPNLIQFEQPSLIQFHYPPQSQELINLED